MPLRGSPDVPSTVFAAGALELDCISLRDLHRHNLAAWRGLTQKYEFLAGVDPEAALLEDLVHQAYDAVWLQLTHAAQRFRRVWAPLEQEWFCQLQQVFQHRMPPDTVFTGKVGLGILFPRSVERSEFLTCFALSDEDVCELTAHETSHFYFFNSIAAGRRLDAGASRVDWMLSEAMVPLLLESPDAHRLFGPARCTTSYAVSGEQLDGLRDIFQAARAHPDYRWPQAYEQMRSYLSNSQTTTSSCL